MSLTSELRDTDSEVARFFAERLPAVQDAAAALRRWTACLPASVRPAASCPVPAWVLGTTVDHRIRVSLGTPYGTPVRIGIRRFRPDDGRVRDAVQHAGGEILAELEAFTGAPLLDARDGTG